MFFNAQDSLSILAALQKAGILGNNQTMMQTPNNTAHRPLAPHFKTNLFRSRVGRKHLHCHMLWRHRNLMPNAADLVQANNSWGCLNRKSQQRFRPEGQFPHNSIVPLQALASMTHTCNHHMPSMTESPRTSLHGVCVARMQLTIQNQDCHCFKKGDILWSCSSARVLHSLPIWNTTGYTRTS